MHNYYTYFVVSCLLARWRYYFEYKCLNRVGLYFDCKTKLCLIVPGRHGEYIFTQESFYLQGNDINEQNTSFLHCKHKHMTKGRAPPGKVLVLYRLLPIEFHGFTNRIDF